MAKGFTSRPALISEAVMKFGTMAMSWPDRRRQRQEIAVGLGLGTAGELGHACSLEPSSPVVLLRLFVLGTAVH